MEIKFKNLEDFNNNLKFFKNNIKYDGLDLDYIDEVGLSVYNYIYNYIKNIILNNFNNIYNLLDIELITDNLLSAKLSEDFINIAKADIYFEILYQINNNIK